jgi:hypothetical protein
VRESVTSVSVTPEVAAPSDQIVAHVALGSAHQDVAVTAAWFGTDSWLIAQEEKSARPGQRQIDFSAPKSASSEKGRQHVHISVGGVHIADADFKVQ